MIKTRFAPSPTGYIHLGNMRTALFNALIAYHNKGIFLLRIEDTDLERSDDVYIDSLMEDLLWLGLHWQEGIEVGGDQAPYRQSQRAAVYEHYYQQLIDEKRAYPCFCTDEQLAMSRKALQRAGLPPRYDGRCARLTTEEITQKQMQGLPSVLRFKIPEGIEIKFNDLVQGEKTFKADDIGDFIIRRTNGMPSFMFCNAIDDALMKVTYAMRGEDHLTNTPRQITILQALKLPQPQYGHFALINGVDGAPLSKRNGSQSIRTMREEGYWPEAVINYLARLGHSYKSNAFMNLAELGAAFEIEDLGRSPARFDPGNLLHWQKEALKQQSNEAIWTWMGAEVQALVPIEKRDNFIAGVRANIIFPADALYWAQLAFGRFEFNDECKTVIKATPAGFFGNVIDTIQADGLNYAAWLENLKLRYDVKGKALFQPLRVALMGTMHGPQMEEWIALLGSEETVIARLKAAEAMSNKGMNKQHASDF